MIEFVCASHNEGVLQKNLLKSWTQEVEDITIQEGFTNIPKAYNEAKKYLSIVSLIAVYVHEDVYLPEQFISDLQKALKTVPDDWGVLGVAGVKLIDDKKELRGFIKDRGRTWGTPKGLPAEVDTLDEMLLITRGDLVFDEQFPLDFYGADICLQAKAQGRKCYAINAYCEHNSSRAIGGRTQAFYEAEERFRNKWIDYLPIATTCSLIK